MNYGDIVKVEGDIGRLWRDPHSKTIDESEYIYCRLANFDIHTTKLSDISQPTDEEKLTFIKDELHATVSFLALEVHQIGDYTILECASLLPCSDPLRALQTTFIPYVDYASVGVFVDSLDKALLLAIDSKNNNKFSHALSTLMSLFSRD